MWMAVLVHDEESGKKAEPVAPPAKQAAPSPAVPQETRPPKPRDEPRRPVVDEAPDPTVDVYPAVAGVDTDVRTNAASSVPLPAPAALPDTLAFSRAWRPFRHATKPGRREVLDVDATIRATVEAMGQLQPVMRRTPEPLFRAHVLVDSGSSMTIWDKPLRGFVDAMRRTNVFSSVEYWELSTTDGLPTPVRAATGRRVLTPPWTQASSKDIVLVATEAREAHWRSAQWCRAVLSWGNHALLAFVNPLPPRWWSRTALPAHTVRVKADPGAATNLALSARAPRRMRSSTTGTPVPVLTLAATDVQAWCHTMVDAHPDGALGVLLTDDNASVRERPATGADAVAGFRRLGSPSAWRLAVLLSASDVHVLETMRLVQDNLAADSTIADLAQVLASGLLTEHRPGAFRFSPDAQRLLHAELLSYDAYRVARCLRDSFERELGANALRVLIEDPSGVEHLPDRLGVLGSASLSALRALGVPAVRPPQSRGRRVLYTFPFGEEAAKDTRRLANLLAPMGYEVLAAHPSRIAEIAAVMGARDIVILYVAGVDALPEYVATTAQSFGRNTRAHVLVIADVTTESTELDWDAAMRAAAYQGTNPNRWSMVTVGDPAEPGRRFVDAMQHVLADPGVGDTNEFLGLAEMTTRINAYFDGVRSRRRVVCSSMDVDRPTPFFRNRHFVPQFAAAQANPAMPRRTGWYFKVERDPDELGYVIESWFTGRTGAPIRWRRRVPLSHFPDVNLYEPLNLQSEAAAVPLGDVLFASFFGELAQAWRHTEEMRYTRVDLEIHPEELRTRPWEVMRDTDDTWRFSANEQPGVRFGDSATGSWRPPPLPAPVRLLVVVGDDTPLETVYDKLEAIYRGLRGAPCGWQVDVLSRQLPDVTEHDPHIVHYIGTQQPSTVRWRPHLTVVDTQSAAVLRERLLGENSAAVIYNQDLLTPAESACFVEEFYRALTQGEPIDRAMAFARRAMRADSSAGTTGWAVPVLECAMNPALVFRQAWRADLRALLDKDPAFGGVFTFVGRAAELNRLHNRLERGPGDSDLLFLTGERGIGKTALLMCCVARLTLNQQPVVYLRFDARAVGGSTAFVREFAQIARWWLEDPRAKERCEQLENRIMRTPADAYEALRACLADLGRLRPLVVVLDDLSIAASAAELTQSILTPAATNQLPGVRLVVAGPSEPWEVLAGGVFTADRVLELRNFRKEDAPLLVREYLAKAEPPHPDPARWPKFRSMMLDWATEQRWSRGLSPSRLVEAARAFTDSPTGRLPHFD
nr:SAV_2336 N-terminal domain-related protein [Kibdelosporangium phytohabitans]